jgi:hypothetical protein
MSSEIYVPDYRFLAEAKHATASRMRSTVRRPTPGPPSLIGPLPTLRQERIQKPLPVIEACRLQPVEGHREVNEPLPRREVEHTQRASRGELSPAREGHTRLIIHQHEIRLDSQSERDHRALAPIELQSGGRAFACIGIGSYLKPGGRLRDPCPHRRRRFGIRKFVTDGLRRQYPVEQLGQQRDIPRQHQIV